MDSIESYHTRDTTMTYNSSAEMYESKNTAICRHISIIKDEFIRFFFSFQISNSSYSQSHTRRKRRRRRRREKCVSSRVAFGVYSVHHAIMMWFPFLPFLLRINVTHACTLYTRIPMHMMWHTKYTSHTATQSSDAQNAMNVRCSHSTQFTSGLFIWDNKHNNTLAWHP